MTKPEAVKPPDSSQSAGASPQPAATQQHLATPSSAPAPAGPAAFETESAPATRPARGRGEPQRSASASRTSRSSAPRSTAPNSPAGSPAPASSQHAPVAAPLAPIPSSGPEPSANHLAEPPSPLAPPPPNDATLADLASEPAQYPPSRLSGLRNLLVSLGRRSLNHDDEIPDESGPSIEPRFERATVRPAYQDSIVSADAAPENVLSTRLSAQPEFLPPRPNAEVEKEKEMESVRPTPPRRDTPEGDEIQTLPSWRGQYRKKRYPPI